MFVSFTDWEFDGNVENVVEGIKENWAAMKEYGAVNTRCTVTGENTLRTMTLWSSQETLDANVDKIRAISDVGVRHDTNKRYERSTRSRA